MKENMQLYYDTMCQYFPFIQVPISPKRTLATAGTVPSTSSATTTTTAATPTTTATSSGGGSGEVSAPTTSAQTTPPTSSVALQPSAHVSEGLCAASPVSATPTTTTTPTTSTGNAQSIAPDDPMLVLVIAAAQAAVDRVLNPPPWQQPVRRQVQLLRQPHQLLNQLQPRLARPRPPQKRLRKYN